MAAHCVRSPLFGTQVAAGGGASNEAEAAWEAAVVGLLAQYPLMPADRIHRAVQVLKPKRCATSLILFDRPVGAPRSPTRCSCFCSRSDTRCLAAQPGALSHASSHAVRWARVRAWHVAAALQAGHGAGAAAGPAGANGQGGGAGGPGRKVRPCPPALSSTPGSPWLPPVPAGAMRNAASLRATSCTTPCCWWPRRASSAGTGCTPRTATRRPAASGRRRRCRRPARRQPRPAAEPPPRQPVRGSTEGAGSKPLLAGLVQPVRSGVACNLAR